LYSSSVISPLASLSFNFCTGSFAGIIRIRIINKKGLPQGEPAIFAINHSTDADPVIILGALKKKIYFFSEGEAYDNRFTNFFMRRFANSTPVFKKQAKKNIKSFRDYFSISKKKNVFFGIFPEGLVNKKAGFSKFYKGTAYLSYKTKIPIIPVYLHNTNKGPDSNRWIFTNVITRSLISLTINAFRKIYVFIGNPIDPMAENIEKECWEMTNPKTYRHMVDEINETLKKEFSGLNNKAYLLFESAEDDVDILNDLEDLSEDTV
jgi:1-acyl-sn-glycerol-3-phosphate acyltransferase